VDPPPMSGHTEAPAWRRAQGQHEDQGVLRSVKSLSGGAAARQLREWACHPSRLSPRQAVGVYPDQRRKARVKALASE